MGKIENCKVLVGNLLLDFDFKRMASILNVPNEEFRERAYHSMLGNLTTIKSELGHIPPSEKIRKDLVVEYEKLLGPFTYSKLEEGVLKLMKELDQKFSTEKWLFQKVPKREGRELKIREGVMIVHRKFFTREWETEIIFELKEGKIEDLNVLKTSNHNIQTEILKEGLYGMVFEEKQVLNNINELHERKEN